MQFRRTLCDRAVRTPESDRADRHVSCSHACAKKILIIGGNSDLIKPFFTNLNNDLIETLCFGRKDWDLKNPIPPDSILKEICDFNPNQLIYAAGKNVPNDLTLETKEIIN